jgi:hypothetical protein
MILRVFLDCELFKSVGKGLFPVDRSIRKDMHAEYDLYGDIVSREMDARNK